MLNSSLRSTSKHFSTACLSKDYYSVLGLQIGAKQSDIRQAYLTLAKQYHPDTPSGDAEKFKEIGEAYEKLNDPSIKAESKRRPETSDYKYDAQEYENRYRDYNEEYHRQKEWAYQDRHRSSRHYYEKVHGYEYQDPYLYKTERYTYSQYKFDKHHNNHNWKNYERKKTTTEPPKSSKRKKTGSLKYYLYTLAVVSMIQYFKMIYSSPNVIHSNKQK